MLLQVMPLDFHGEAVLNEEGGLPQVDIQTQDLLYNTPCQLLVFHTDHKLLLERWRTYLRSLIESL